MEKVLSSCFNRVEVALASLIDSTAKCNPNPVHATELVNADAELNLGLEKLTIHQSNYCQILSLQKTSEFLDNEICRTLEQLVSVRKELISIPVTKPTSNVNSVPYTELLDYARRISKFSLPPSYQDPIINNEVATDAIYKTTTETLLLTPEDGSSVQDNVTKKTTLNGQEHSAASVKKDLITTVPIDAEPTSQSTIITNNNNWSDYLNPRSEKLWTPWPSEETIRRGALASIQILVNQGLDLATLDPEKRAEFGTELVNEDDRQDVDQNMLTESDRNTHIGRLPTNTLASYPDKSQHSSKTKVFQLETLDDDDDEEED